MITRYEILLVTCVTAQEKKQKLVFIPDADYVSYLLWSTTKRSSIVPAVDTSSWKFSLLVLFPSGTFLER